jgi:predicted HicB family RNase H-like nuclease
MEVSEATPTRRIKAVTFRIPVDLHARMRVAAARDDLSLTAWTLRMLEFAASASEKRHA